MIKSGVNKFHSITRISNYRPMNFLIYGCLYGAYSKLPFLNTCRIILIKRIGVCVDSVLGVLIFHV